MRCHLFETALLLKESYQFKFRQELWAPQLSNSTVTEELSRLTTWRQLCLHTWLAVASTFTSWTKVVGAVFEPVRHRNANCADGWTLVGFLNITGQFCTKVLIKWYLLCFYVMTNQPMSPVWKYLAFSPSSYWHI